MLCNPWPRPSAVQHLGSTARAPFPPGHHGPTSDSRLPSGLPKTKLANCPPGSLLAALVMRMLEGGPAAPFALHDGSDTRGRSLCDGAGAREVSSGLRGREASRAAQPDERRRSEALLPCLLSSAKPRPDDARGVRSTLAGGRAGRPAPPQRRLKEARPNEVAASGCPCPPFSERPPSPSLPLPPPTSLAAMGKNQSKLSPEQLSDLQKNTYCQSLSESGVRAREAAPRTASSPRPPALDAPAVRLGSHAGHLRLGCGVFLHAGLSSETSSAWDG